MTGVCVTQRRSGASRRVEKAVILSGVPPWAQAGAERSRRTSNYSRAEAAGEKGATRTKAQRRKALKTEDLSPLRLCAFVRATPQTAHRLRPRNSERSFDSVPARLRPPGTPLRMTAFSKLRSAFPSAPLRLGGFSTSTARA